MNHETSSYLMHHGVKGMKWGVRHDKDRVKRSKAPKEKSKSTLKLEKKYKEKYGFTDKEASEEAAKTQRVRKIMAISAGVTVAACAAVVAKKNYDYTTDKLIKAGASIQNINRSTNGIDTNRSFYATINKKDHAKYIGDHAAYLNRLTAKDKAAGLDVAGKSAKQTMLKVGDRGLKIASQKSGLDTIKKMADKDPSFIKDMKALIEDIPSSELGSVDQALTQRFALEHLNKGKIDKRVYDAFNLGLAARSDSSKKTIGKFYEALKDQGYGGVIDVNDKKLSFVKAKAPVVVFGDKQGSVISSQKTVELGKDTIKKYMKKTSSDRNRRDLAKQGAAYTAMFAPLVAVSVKVNKSSDYNYVREYRKQHPNSKLSKDEIIRIRRDSL